MTALADRLAAEARVALGRAAGRFVRVEIPVEGISPLPWLAAQRHPIKGYWSARDGSLEMAAIGEADEIKFPDVAESGGVFDEVARRLAGCDPEIRYFGGFRFGPWHAADPAWRPFGACRFLLPQVELVRRGGSVSIACNVPAQDDAAASRALDVIGGVNMSVRAVRGPLPPPVARQDVPGRAEWDRGVAAVRDAIAGGRLRKLVLARRACFDFSEPLDPFELLLRLRESTADCYHFCGIHAGGRAAFMGASPERFFIRMGGGLLSEAIAGTRPRGATPEEDHALAQELMGSAKEREEHAIVVQGIAEALEPLCSVLKHEPAPHVVKLTRVQHLVTHFVGQLKAEATAAQVFARLHPTPAVGGYPRAAAVALLPQLESFDRGWYCAPVGWISRDACELAVAIRCGAVFANRLCLFSGAGIVAGSDAAEEWNEVEIKIAHFISALT